jgi:hypothetical protein
LILNEKLRVVGFAAIEEKRADTDEQTVCANCPGGLFAKVRNQQAMLIGTWGIL